MKKLYSLIVFTLLLLIQLFECGGNFVFAQQKLQVPDSTKAKSPTKITDTRPEKPAVAEVGVGITPFKPGSKISSTPGQTPKVPGLEDDKVISNVKVFPNPISDQISLAYRVSKDTNVTIKIMDILGNEITTLLSQRVSAGERIDNFPLTSLNSGLYFVRLVAGNESVVKRISVL